MFPQINTEIQTQTQCFLKRARNAISNSTIGTSLKNSAELNFLPGSHACWRGLGVKFGHSTLMMCPLVLSIQHLMDATPPDAGFTGFSSGSRNFCNSANRLILYDCPSKFPRNSDSIGTRTLVAVWLTLNTLTHRV